MSGIAITGIGLQSALGSSLEATVDGLQQDRVGVRKPLYLEQVPRISAGAGEVPLALEQSGESRAESLLCRALEEALSPSDRESILNDGTRWGLVLGTTLAGVRHCGVGYRAEVAGDLRSTEEAMARSPASAVLARVLTRIPITGPSITISCACASALTAISHACALLRAGVVDAVIAGGYDPIAEFSYGGFAALQLVAVTPLSPFAPNREGMKVGEGAAVFVLRRVESLSEEKRGKALGTIEACCETSDAHHLTQPHPEGLGLSRALAGVLEQSAATVRNDGSKVAGTSVLPSVLVAHGTGTAGNDSAEYSGYRLALGAGLSQVPVVALKSRFGHPLGAAGAMEAASLLGCAKRGFVPTTAGRGRDVEAFPELDLVEGAPRTMSVRDFVVLSAGFGGANAAIRIRCAPVVKECDMSAARSSAMRVRAIGAVTPAGRGVDAIRLLADSHSTRRDIDEAVLAPLLDRARTRRIALLPRLMIAAIRDLLESNSIDGRELKSIPLVAAHWLGAVDFTDRYYRDLVASGIDLANPMLFAESVPNAGSAHCSLAYRMEASSVSVVGRRTAALEALALVSARFASGQWDRALVVVADEGHALVERVLERTTGVKIPFVPGAIALLVERDCMQAPVPEGLVITDVFGRTGTGSLARGVVNFARGIREWGSVSISSSPLDDALRRVSSLGEQVQLPEMGSTTAFAVLASQVTQRSGAVAASDPHGAWWAIRHTRR